MPVSSPPTSVGVPSSLAPFILDFGNPAMAFWNTHNTLILIEEFKRSTCLWDAADPDYKKRDVKAEAYKRIGSMFGVSPVQAESKIQALRNQFRREQRRMEDMMYMGTEPKRPTWFGYDKLLFLLPHYQSRGSVSGGHEVPEDFDLFSLDGGSFHGHLIENSVPDPEESQIDRKPSLPLGEVKPPSTGLIVERKPADSGKEEGQPLLKRKREPGGSPGPSTQESWPSQSVFPSEGWHHPGAALQRRRDEHSVFGEYVGNELRKMSTRSQIVVKHLISNILYDAAFGKFDGDGFPQPSPEPSSVSSNRTE